MALIRQTKIFRGVDGMEECHATVEVSTNGIRISLEVEEFNSEIAHELAGAIQGAAFYLDGVSARRL